MKTLITIEARMRSTRLPGKVLMPVLGRPLLALMIERLQRVWQADEIVVATTTNVADDPIVNLARQLGVGWFRGSEEDVLDRVLKAAQLAKADVLVELTGDCPLIDPAVVDQIIATFYSNQVDYCSNTLQRTYPRGMDTQVFPVSVLAEVATLTQDPADHEHVSLYIYEHPERYRLLNVASGLQAAIARLRLTVDTAEDFQLVRHIYEILYPSKPDFGLVDIIKLFEHRSDLFLINQHILQKQVRPI